MPSLYHTSPGLPGHVRGLLFGSFPFSMSRLLSFFFSVVVVVVPGRFDLVGPGVHSTVALVEGWNVHAVEANENELVRAK